MIIQYNQENKYSRLQILGDQKTNKDFCVYIMRFSLYQL